MKILVLGLNYAPEKVGIAVYTTGMAEALAEAGHDVRVIAGQPYYPAWRSISPHRAWAYSRRRENGVAVTRVPHYIPRNPTGARRLVHHFTFALAALVPALWQGLAFRPQLVIAIAPSLMAAPVARLAALACGARAWLHVQDFEVEAAFATGLIDGDGLLARLARRFERIMGSFHRVSAISPEMCAKLVDKGVEPARVVEFRNWADLEAIKPLAAPSPYRVEWGIATPHVALYSGNIANKQGIGIVLAAARRLAHRTDLTFVVCGEGPNRTALEAEAAGLANIVFRDLQPAARLNELMGLATVHLLPQLAGTADLVLPSKLTNMLASGRPVVATAAAGTGLYREVEGCGLVVAPGDEAGFAEAIERLIDDPEAQARMARAARARAEERWGKAVVLASFLAELRQPDALEALVPAKGVR